MPYYFIKTQWNILMGKNLKDFIVLKRVDILLNKFLVKEHYNYLCFQTTIIAIMFSITLTFYSGKIPHCFTKQKIFMPFFFPIFFHSNNHSLHICLLKSYPLFKTQTMLVAYLPKHF